MSNNFVMLDIKWNKITYQALKPTRISDIQWNKSIKIVLTFLHWFNYIILSRAFANRNFFCSRMKAFLHVFKEQKKWNFVLSAHNGSLSFSFWMLVSFHSVLQTSFGTNYGPFGIWEIFLTLDKVLMMSKEQKYQCLLGKYISKNKDSCCVRWSEKRNIH